MIIMSEANAGVKIQEQRIKEKRQSRIGEIWRRLKVNKGSVAGLVIILLLTAMALFAPYLAPFDPNKMNAGPRLAPPSWNFPLGTDSFGRDQLSRVIYGARISLYVGFIAVGIGAIFGGMIGAIVGYYGGRIDNILMRLMDVLLAVPQIILAIAIVGALGANLINLMIAVGVSQIPRYARIVRASALSVRGQEFIEAARANENTGRGKIAVGAHLKIPPTAQIVIGLFKT